MTKRTILLVIAALSIVPLPAHAASEPSRVRQRPGQVALTGGVTGIDVTREPSKDVAPLERISESLTRSKDLGGSGMIALHELSEQAAAAEETGAESGWGAPIGDIDGDGLTDVITYESNPTSEAIVGRLGTNAESLWRVELPPWYEYHGQLRGYSFNWTWIGLQDLNGDEVQDLFLFTFSEQRNPVTSITRKMNYRISAVDGKTGSTVWTWSLEGRSTYAGTYSPRVQVLKNVVWNFALFADATGDAVTDPFVQICNSKSVAFPGSFINLEGECDAIHLDGTTGDQVTNVTIAGATPAAIHPVGDLDADGSGDLAYVQRSSGWFDDVVAMSASGARIWTNSVPRSEEAWVFPTNLDGSSGSDLMFFGYDYSEETLYERGFRLAAFEGTAGAAMWSRQLPWEISISTVPDIDGDGGSDLFSSTGGSETIRLSAYDGARFRTKIWSRNLEIDVPPGLEVQPYLTWLGDLNLDGSMEVALTPVMTSFDEYFLGGAQALNGSTGASLWSIPSGAPVPWGLMTDVDGDGTGDLFRSVSVGGGTAIEVLNGMTLGTVWQSAPDEDVQDAYAQAVDLTPSPGLELLTWWAMDQGNLVTAETPSGRAWGLSYSW